MNHTGKTKYRPSNHQSYRRAYVALLVIQGKIYPKGLGMINWSLPGRMELKHMRRHGITTFAMETYI